MAFSCRQSHAKPTRTICMGRVCINARSLLRTNNCIRAVAAIFTSNLNHRQLVFDPESLALLALPSPLEAGIYRLDDINIGAASLFLIYSSHHEKRSAVLIL